MQNGGSHCDKPSKKQGSRKDIENDYSLVSKRSVEKLYCRNEPQFLRPFVAKYKRRSPLINRCFWLRMKAIDHVVHRFITSPILPKSRRVIVNLGCGYDPLPFRTVWRYPKESEDVFFVDLDDPVVIERKLAIIERQNAESTLYDTRNYIAKGYDLQDLPSLAAILDEIVLPQDCQILFIAEDRATRRDTLLNWATRYPQGQFCLLKQTPLKLTSDYNTPDDQYKRLRDAGWPTVHVRDLWGIWLDDDIISADEKRAVCQVEPFDDMEELARYGSRYLVVTADMQPRDQTVADISSDFTASAMPPITAEEKIDGPALDQAVKNRESTTRTRRALPTHSIPKAKTIPRINLLNDLDFGTIILANKPISLPNLNIGPCTTLWTSSYLLSHLNPTTTLTIHRATSRNLTFHPKNYTYENATLSAFLDSALRSEHVYLRSLSSTGATKKATLLAEDFPCIAGDFEIPERLRGVITRESVHSSVLRVTGDVNMWLHYDVMANILCQVRGSKRVVMFPSSDVSCLGFAPGETTSELDVFSPDGEELRVPVDSHSVEVTLNPGDVLFIPPCWPHATAVATKSNMDKEEALSVAVNVFFRTFSLGDYAAGRDVYGNRDVSAYENGRRDLKRLIEMLRQVPGGTGHDHEKAEETSEAVSAFIVNGEKKACLENKVIRLGEQIRRRFKGLPADVSDFYLRRLGDEVVEQMERSE